MERRRLRLGYLRARLTEAVLPPRRAPRTRTSSTVCVACRARSRMPAPRTPGRGSRRRARTRPSSWPTPDHGTGKVEVESRGDRASDGSTVRTFLSCHRCGRKNQMWRMYTLTRSIRLVQWRRARSTAHHLEDTAISTIWGALCASLRSGGRGLPTRATSRSLSSVAGPANAV